MMSDNLSSTPPEAIERTLAEDIERRAFYRLLPEADPQNYPPPTRLLLQQVEAGLRKLL